MFVRLIGLKRYNIFNENTNFLVNNNNKIYSVVWNFQFEFTTAYWYNCSRRICIQTIVIVVKVFNFENEQVVIWCILQRRIRLERVRNKCHCRLTALQNVYAITQNGFRDFTKWKKFCAQFRKYVFSSIFCL